MHAVTNEELERLLEAALADTRGHFDQSVQRLSEENRRHFDTSTEDVKSELRLVV
jgi:hypothetical protein